MMNSETRGKAIADATMLIAQRFPLDVAVASQIAGELAHANLLAAPQPEPAEGGEREALIAMVIATPGIETTRKDAARVADLILATRPVPVQEDDRADQPDEITGLRERIRDLEAEVSRLSITANRKDQS